MMVTPMQKISFRARSLFGGLVHDCRGLAATEFAVIVPLMLTMFFGLVEFSSGVAVDRKQTALKNLIVKAKAPGSAVTDEQLRKAVADVLGVERQCQLLGASESGTGSSS